MVSFFALTGALIGLMVSPAVAEGNHASGGEFSPSIDVPLSGKSSQQSGDASSRIQGAIGAVSDSKGPWPSVQQTDASAEAPLSLKPARTLEVEQPVKSKLVQYNAKRHRSDMLAACKMAKNHWLDKAVEADPSIVEAICRHYAAALILAHHPRLGAIAQYDHYTCRRLCQWVTVARALAKNGDCQKVIAYDAEGIYAAIKRDPTLAGILAKNPMFPQMVADNPDLGRFMSLYM
jgi:hypothetical protein